MVAQPLVITLALLAKSSKDSLAQRMSAKDWATRDANRCPSENTLLAAIRVFFRAVSLLCVWQPLVAFSWVNMFGGFEGGTDKSLL